MSAEPVYAAPQPSNVIQLGGETAVVIPMDAYRRLQALMLLAPADLLDQAEEAVQSGADHDWSAGGRGISGAELRARLGLSGR